MEGWWAASYLGLWLLVVTLCVVVVALARQIGTLHLRLAPHGALEVDDEGPPLGEKLKPLVTPDVQGREVTVAQPGQAQLLLFVSPGCKVCDQVLPSVPVLARSHELMPFIISDADRSDTLRAYDPKKWRAPVIADLDIAREYAIPGSPYALILDPDGVVRGKGTVNNLEQMEGLVETAGGRMSGRAAEHAVP